MAMPKLSGQRLVIWAAIAGIVLIAVSKLIVLILNKYCPGVGQYWQEIIFPGAFTGTSTIAMLLGLVLPSCLNRFIDLPKTHARSLDRFGNELEKLIHRSMLESLQVQLTLTNGKIYVGYIQTAPESMSVENSYTRILPTISGYRDPSTKEVVFVTEYASIYESIWSSDENKSTDIDINDFVKVIASSNIFTASIYDPDVYLKFE